MQLRDGPSSDSAAADLIIQLSRGGYMATCPLKGDSHSCPQATTLPPEPQLALSLPGQEDNEKKVDKEPAAVSSGGSIHTSSLLGAEDADDETLLLSDTLSRSSGPLDKPRVRLQKKFCVTEEVLEQLRGIVNEGDPKTKYIDFVQVGQGWP
ncbi:serine/threonine-protein kinase PAK 3-like isoform X2 [Melospiza georgiana]|uniref:serine/threonine-protein kinase PAK 3-like isoform X2 n=1 Tax=Melospiza georgiana TaxID=44398 RepID=UPI0025AC06BC|nr:serine/threonine-protein kinase PAK 3-like isoform X2 [Melospiza georgiana]